MVFFLKHAWHVTLLAEVVNMKMSLLNAKFSDSLSVCAFLQQNVYFAQQHTTTKPHWNSA